MNELVMLNNWIMDLYESIKISDLDERPFLREELSKLLSIKEDILRKECEVEKAE